MQGIRHVINVKPKFAQAGTKPSIKAYLTVAAKARRGGVSVHQAPAPRARQSAASAKSFLARVAITPTVMSAIVNIQQQNMARKRRAQHVIMVSLHVINAYVVRRQIVNGITIIKALQTSAISAAMDYMRHA